MARIIEGEKMNMVGGKVKELRMERNLSQQTLSNRLETYAIYICRSSVSRIEDWRRFSVSRWARCLKKKNR